MISVKDAVKDASGFFSEMFPNAQDVRLEEVELSEEGPWWDITLSFARPSQSTFDLMVGQPNRIYKVVRVDGETGEARSVKIRKI